MSEKLCLRWNDFQENVNTAFANLREDNEFADVTLACEDNKQIEAHKVILARSCPFFQALLKRNLHPHPFIYMRGMKSENLIAIVDFLYCGEANVFQENLDPFLAIAEELKVKGLMGQTKEVDTKTEIKFMDQTPRQMNSNPSYKKVLPRERLGLNIEHIEANLEPKVDEQPPNLQINNERRIEIHNFVSGGGLQELDEQVKSMMERSQNFISSKQGRAKICKICGKEGQAVSIRDHISFILSYILYCDIINLFLQDKIVFNTELQSIKILLDLD